MAARICCHAGPEFETVAGCLKEGDREATPRAGLKGSRAQNAFTHCDGARGLLAF